MPDSPDPDRWARLRFSIVGPLLAAPPPTGELRAALQALAKKTWSHPVKGTAIRFGFATIERWYYQARNADDPIAALRRRPRDDHGRCRTLTPAQIQALEAQYRAHTGWTVQLHYDNLKAQSQEEPALGALPSYSTVRRYMKAQGLIRKRKPRRNTPGAKQAEARLERREVRSYEADYVHSLWHSDFHHGSVVVLTTTGVWVKPLALCILDDHSRLVCHMQWYLEETAEALVHGVSQALQKRGLPRSLMTDNGSAMLCEEFTAGLHRLGILHETTLPYSPYQNAKQETFWATLEGRLMAMLEGVGDLTLERLNEITQAWVEQGYHRDRHREIAATPLQRYLDAPSVGRDCPDSRALARAFCRTVERKQRKSDGTVALAGKRFEIPNRFRHLERVTLRYAQWDLRSVALIDERTQAALASLYPLNKSANADGQRRALENPRDQTDEPASNELPALLRQMLADYAATGRPPAYLPQTNSESAP
jgi:putative transposase